MNYTEMKKWKALRLAQAEQRNEKKNLIKSTNAKKLKPIKIKLKNNVEVYSYLKNDVLFGFCVVKPFTSIRWHYEFTSLAELDKYATLTMILDLQRQLRELNQNL